MFLFSWDDWGSVPELLSKSARNDRSWDGGFIHISVIARPVGFRPKRSPNVDQGLYCRWRLLRSGSALPKLFFFWDYYSKAPEVHPKPHRNDNTVDRCSRH